MENISFRNVLKEKTRQQHSELEEKIQLLSPGITLDLYISSLEKFFGYIYPLEILMKKIHPFAGWHPQYRSNFIIKDLMKLKGARGGNPERELPLSQRLPLLKNQDHLIGYLYVIEGSSLGNILIGRHIKSHLGLTEDHGCSYFSVDVSSTWKRWDLFCSLLENYVKTSATSVEEIIHTSQQTFKLFGKWLESWIQLIPLSWLIA